MSTAFRWLLELDPDGGRVRRYSTETVKVTRNDGRVIVFSGGLLDLDAAIGDAEIEITIRDHTRWSSLADRLQAAAVHLWRWPVGAPFESSVLFARGRVGELGHGAQGEPLTFALELEQQVDQPDIPDERSTITSSTFPITAGFLLNYEADGDYYPIVFGTPGKSSFAAGGAWPCVPAPCAQVPDYDDPAHAGAISWTQDPWLVLSEDPTTCRPTSIVLQSDSDEHRATQTPEIATDKRGRKLVMTSFAGDVFQTPPNTGQERFWYGVITASGGIRDMYGAIEYVLRRFTPDSVDWSRIGEVRAWLERYLVDTWIDGPLAGGPWQFVESLLEHLPVVVRQGQRGRYFLLQRHTADPRLTRRVVSTEQLDVARTSDVRYVGKGFSKITARFGDYRGRLVGVAAYGPETTDYAFVRGHSTLAIAQSRYPNRPQIKIDVPWTFDQGTAYKVLEDIIRRDALPHREVTLRVPERWGLRENDQIMINDPSVDLVDELAIIDEPPVIGPLGMSLHLRIPAVL